eukprot:9000953-Alexandrium_andersonii.AAC.1
MHPAGVPSRWAGTKACPAPWATGISDKGPRLGPMRGLRAPPPGTAPGMTTGPARAPRGARQSACAGWPRASAQPAEGQR